MKEEGPHNYFLLESLLTTELDDLYKFYFLVFFREEQTQRVSFNYLSLSRFTSLYSIVVSGGSWHCFLIFSFKIFCLFLGIWVFCLHVYT